MDTIPEPFSLRNPSGHPPARRGGFRVPFGLKDGQVWTPGEVAKGKSCGCVCPGCHAPLVAKAQESRRKRAHFSHLVDSYCRTGRETGIHMRAKQLIAERHELLIPAWDGDLIDMPNPPHARDIDGRLHHGRQIQRPARRVQLREVGMERPLDGYQPDVYARDDQGELLIEIRVTHAVSDVKAGRVQAHQRRMVEIDLSGLDRDTPHDPLAFEQAVLFDSANRAWVSFPEAVSDWKASKRDLEARVAARNRDIMRLRDQQAKAAQARRDREITQNVDKEQLKANMRQRLRSQHEGDLAQLIGLTQPDRVEQIRRDYRLDAESRVAELMESVPIAVRHACSRAHENAWVFGVDSALWQLLAYDHFVAKQLHGRRFNQKDVAAWVRRSFHPDPVLYRLFVVQYANRAEARRAGVFKRRLAYWVFTEEENQRIPNFYAPINDFVDRLAAAGVVRRLWETLGECEVLSPQAVITSHGPW